MISASAPGKAVLSGEYVVLQDAPAIAAAIDRRVRVSLEQSSVACNSLTAPGYLDGSWSFRVNEAGAIVWQEALPGPAAFSLVEQVWKSFDTAAWSPVALVIDTRDFSDTASGLKLGLGSSAAVAVALTAALQQFGGADSDIEAIARQAHERFQGGRGSGIDVATSLHGGVLRYRRAANQVQRLEWPAELHYRYLWSGRAAVTADKLAALDRSLVRDPAGSSMAPLSDHARRVSAAWSRGDSSEILKSFPAYIDALRQFSDEHDLGIFDAGHAELVRQARDRGIVYKPCGAGGGDIGIVLAACEHDMEEFCERVCQLEFRVLDIALDNRGVLLAE